METTGKKAVSFYFHIPFCKKKCPYCHFYVIGDSESKKDLLLDAFLKEWVLLNIPQDVTIKSIYFGGGTPSLFGPHRIKRLLDFILTKIQFDLEDIEITLEANPCDVNLDLMKGYRSSGINRVSLGVQSFHDDSLVTIGRKHSSSHALDAIKAIYDAGIKNISIDLMYDRPHQTLDMWKKELDVLKGLPITHLSLYNMTIEEGSAYKRQEKKITSLMPSDELSLQLHKLAIEAIEAAGLKRYEISAFAKDNHQSIHNLGYWQGREFYGLGPSSFSYIQKSRKQNVPNFQLYIDRINMGELAYGFEETLDDDASRRELLAIGLRVVEGVDLLEFQRKFGPLSQDVFKSLEKLQMQGYLSIQNSHVALTENGRLFYNDVGVELS
jgi:oxygen-independent coproporphyrinogen III oxidase